MSEIGRYFRATLALLIVVLILLPMFYMVSMSLRPLAEVNASPLGLPTSLYLDNYFKVMATMNYWRSVGNTIFITVITTFFVAVISSMAAYPLARVRSRVSGMTYALLVLGLTLPGFVSLAPLYVLLRDLGLLNSYAGVIIAYIAGNLPLGVFFYTSFLKSLPEELDDAAVLDGANPLQIYWQIILPLLRPITATLALFVTMSVWNDLVFPVLFLSDERKYTVTVAVFRFLGSRNTDPTMLFPAVVLGVAPLIILFLILQRQIVNGIAAGATKG